MAESSTIGMVSKIVVLLSEQLGIEVEKLGPASRFDSLGMDSLDYMELVGKIRDEVGPVTNKQLFLISTVGEMADAIARNLDSVPA